MAAGTLTIDFNANYNGTHLIKYKKTTDAGYLSFTTGILALGPNSIPIGITLEPDSCEIVDFEGYVQPTCQPESTTDGRVPFACSYVPAEECYSARITCDEADIVGPIGSSNGFEITNRGAGYLVPPAAAPAVTFSSGTATAQAYISDSGAKDISLNTDPGGHTIAAQVYPAVPATATSGAGDFANTFVDVEVDAAGAVISVSITSTPDLNSNIGSGYIVADTITLGTLTVGPNTLNAGVIVDVDSLWLTGELLEILLTSNDTYNTTPTIAIDPPPPAVKLATADVIMNPCSSFNKTDCNAALSIALRLELQESMIICGDRTVDPYPFVEVPADYVQVHDGCCYSGNQYTFTNNEAANITLTYLDHATGTWSTTPLVPAVPQVICITTDAWYLEDAGANVTVAIGAAC